MTANYFYISDFVVQANKRTNLTCGDYFLSSRTSEHSVFILCDGIGSGIRANIAAIMCANRLLRLLESGISLYRASEMVISMMHKARTEENVPFAAFSIAWILNNGQYTVLSYESPAPLLVEQVGSHPLPQRYFTLGNELVSEANGILREGDSLILTTDGITQAGLGIIRGFGWGIEGFDRYINTEITRDKMMEEIAQGAVDKAYLLSGQEHADDTTVSVLTCRKAVTLNILSGPPIKRSDDKVYVSAFLDSGGLKAVCGSTTAEIVSRVLQEPIETVTLSTSFSKPPQYRIKGIDIVTEGAITLNQVYNILEEDSDIYEDSCVSSLCLMIKSADIIRFYTGRAYNPGHQDIHFKQLGVLPRKTIIELLIKKLREQGKIVVQYEW